MKRLTAFCPWATTLHAWSKSLEKQVVIAIRCKRWGCDVCGKRKMTHYGRKCEAAKPNRLITLTVDTKLHETPHGAFKATGPKVTHFATRVRRIIPEFEYLKVLEVTKKGWPHYHLVVRSQFIKQAECSRIWAELTGAPIVDVRKIKKPSDVYYYVIKYLGKQKYIPWTDRRMSWSKNFFVKQEFEKVGGLDLCEISRSMKHPIDFLQMHYVGHTFEQFSADVITTDEELDYPVGIPIEVRMKDLNR
jgi:hypothetical protein